MFIFRKQHSLHRLRHCTMLNVRQFSKSCSKEYHVFCPGTSLRLQSRLYLREWDRGRKERTFILRKFLNSKPTAATEPEVSKICQTIFFSCQHHQKRLKIFEIMTYMPNTIFSCQTILKMSKFLEFDPKMPTWQPCPPHGKSLS